LALAARGESRVILLDVPLVYADLGQIGALLERVAPPPTVLQAQLALHESYHLHSQFPTFFDQPARYAWPAWDRQADRTGLTTSCYEGSPEIVAAHAVEMTHLLDAWDHLWTPAGDVADPAAAREDAAAYGASRRARYALLDGVTVPTGTGPASCAVAEDIMELEEGSASWVSSVTATRAGVMTIEQVRASYGQPLNPAFYHTGSFQLWVLDGLLGADAVRAVTSDITQSDRPEGGIFGRFQAAIGS
jgi:hypothetical protein